MHKDTRLSQSCSLSPFMGAVCAVGKLNPLSLRQAINQSRKLWRSLNMTTKQCTYLVIVSYLTRFVLSCILYFKTGFTLIYFDTNSLTLGRPVILCLYPCGTGRQHTSDDVSITHMHVPELDGARKAHCREDRMIGIPKYLYFMPTEIK